MTLGVIILTGGASSRMGADKALLDWNGRRAVDRLADLAAEVGATVVITSGAQPCGLPFAVEDPPGGGPVAGIAAAAAMLRGTCARALVLAVDAPTLRPADLADLLESPAPGASFEDLHLPLVIDLDALPPEAGQGWSMRRFITDAGLAQRTCPQQARARLRGANTPAERDVLLAELVERETAQKSGAG
jgi:molybdopterin-guanine dinucleotide biosynthesis protein A